MLMILSLMNTATFAAWIEYVTFLIKFHTKGVRSASPTMHDAIPPSKLDMQSISIVVCGCILAPRRY